VGGVPVTVCVKQQKSPMEPWVGVRAQVWHASRMKLLARQEMAAPRYANGEGSAPTVAFTAARSGNPAPYPAVESEGAVRRAYEAVNARRRRKRAEGKGWYGFAQYGGRSWHRLPPRAAAAARTGE